MDLKVEFDRKEDRRGVHQGSPIARIQEMEP